MNSRKAKKLRRNAENALYHWYLSILEEEQRDDLTRSMALEYTPVVRYWYESHECVDREGNPYTSQQCRVSEHTKRWFIQQEKKKNGMLYSAA